MADEPRPDPFRKGLLEGFRGALGKSTRVLLAVSGGADSTAMMVGAAELSQVLGVTFAVGSVDHGLREGSAAEAESVVAQASAMGLEAQVVRVSLSPGAGLEARAREARYAALEQLCAELGCQRIATAHTRDDQAETLLMRLSRGTSLRGAAGIRRVTGRVIRPMLELSREEARAFLRRRGVEWIEDSMNADPSFFRVRVRHTVLPALEAAAHGPVAGHLARFATLAADDDAFLTALADTAWTRLLGPEGLDVTGFRALALPVRRRLWVHFLEAAQVSPTFERVAQADAILSSGGRGEVVRGKVLDARGGWLRWVASRDKQPGEQALSEVGQELVLGAFRVGISAHLPAAPWSVAIARAALPLLVRSRRAGDRVPVKGHLRKLQDVLVDAKVPRERRDQWPVFCDSEGKPLWVSGLGNVGPTAPVGQSIWLWSRPI